jgi:hypothetical protein
MGTEIEPLSAVDNVQANPLMGQDNYQAALFQATLAGVKVEPQTGKPTALWNYSRKGCLYEYHKDEGNIKNDVQAGCYEVKTKGEYTLSSFNTENNASLTGFSAKGTDSNFNRLKPFGLGGEWGLDERGGVLEAGAGGRISLAKDPGVKAEAKVGAVALEGDLRGKAGVYPSRWVDGLCNMTEGKNSDIPAISDICNEVSKHDYGIAFSGKAGATIGWAASGEVHGQVKDGKLDIGLSGKLANGVGPILGGNLQVGRFDRNE